MEDIWLARFKREALPRITAEVRPQRVLVFGSRATGTAVPDSDIDVIIVADSFRNIPFFRRMAHILGIARFPKHVDYLCYTPEEFARIRNESSVVSDALVSCAELTV